MLSKILLSISVFGLGLFLNGCGEQNNPQSKITNTTSESKIKTVDITLSLQQLPNTTNQSKSRSTRANLPNLVQFRVTISSDGLNDQTSLYDSNQTSAKITLLIGHIYTATLAALNNQGEVFAEGTSTIDLLVAPPNDSPKLLKITVEPVNVSNIAVTLIPASGSNIMSKQQVYFYLNQPGTVFYSINDQPYLRFDNVESTVGQKLSPLNGQMISIPAQSGTTVSIKYQGESLVVQPDGTEIKQLGPLKEASYQIIQLSNVKQYVNTKSRGKLMTSTSFGVAQLIPLSK
ncbi:MAG: hypothetical protein COB02_00105 [Candidatus Cloacimonadota bacterium]|nr:MAG: hypothetical protein COB02_04240 [Candidatus Cloacimonadota bacterium]PCJ21025.1 MAG: hypothetical protein COB02_00105 [Candidatus Cloacimonadota bacterium]